MTASTSGSVLVSVVSGMQTSPSHTNPGSQDPPMVHAQPSLPTGQSARGSFPHEMKSNREMETATLTTTSRAGMYTENDRGAFIVPIHEICIVEVNHPRAAGTFFAI